MVIHGYPLQCSEFMYYFWSLFSGLSMEFLELFLDTPWNGSIIFDWLGLYKRLKSEKRFKNFWKQAPKILGISQEKLQRFQGKSQKKLSKFSRKSCKIFKNKSEKAPEIPQELSPGKLCNSSIHPFPTHFQNFRQKHSRSFPKLSNKKIPNNSTINNQTNCQQLSAITKSKRAKNNPSHKSTKAKWTESKKQHENILLPSSK